MKNENNQIKGIYKRVQMMDNLIRDAYMEQVQGSWLASSDLGMGLGSPVSFSHMCMCIIM